MDRLSGERWRPPSGEIALAFAFAALGASITWGLLDWPELAPALALTVTHSGFLVWRRRAPELTLVGLGVTAVAFVVSGWPTVGLGPAVLAGVHGLGATRGRRRAAPWLAVSVAVMAFAVAADGVRADTVIGNAVALTAAWWLGDRQRGTSERAARAERDVEERTRRAVAAERLRIARELHDVVAHALSVIAVQSGTGRVVIDDDPETARVALESIEEESRSALDEMRRLLHVLRSEDEPDRGALVPSPGLRELDGLVARTVGSGLPVGVRIEGDPRPLPAGIDLTAYRIVQEALTNVRRHARASRADVRLVWHPSALDVEVVDDGHGANGSMATTSGNGLVGMRERVSLYGGTLDIGNRTPRGFRVGAHLPFGDQQ